MRERADALTGCLVGTAIGDALGLPFEGISAARQQRMTGGVVRHRFVFGRGMVSDDTEHTAMTAQALVASAGDPDDFERRLAWKLRWWLLGLPAGIGLATLRSILKLWLGFGAARSGVFSAGNGPAMRSAIIGVAYGEDLERMCELVRRSSRITHTDPKAFAGALAVAVAAHIARTATQDDALPQAYSDAVEAAFERANLPMEDFAELLKTVLESVRRGESTRDYARSLGLAKGVTGYINHTVPVALHAWLSHPGDFEGAVESAIQCGGDTDTVAAITGAIAGSASGSSGIPTEWKAKIIEYPRNLNWLATIAAQLDTVIETRRPNTQVPLNPLAVLLRNLVFIVIVLSHGFRRLLPPY